MKKRFACLLLAAALLASMVVVPATAAEAPTPATGMTTAPEGECPCGCGSALAEITWTAWDVNGSDGPNSGHYYLDGDYIQDGQMEIMAGDRVVLDLRGNTITTKSYTRLLLVYGRMHVMDTVGGGRIMAKVSGGAYGGVVMVNTNEVNDSLFELCSGVLTVDADNKGSRSGGLVQAAATGTFRMTGGMLLNGTSVNSSNADPGGCVCGSGANTTIEILGGTIVGGVSGTHGGNIYSTGTVILKDCTIIGGTATKSGGNIYQNGGSLTIENCVITDGVTNNTAYGGGNICALSGATVSIKDTLVRNGFANYMGGNIYLGNSTTTMENATVEAGVARNRGHNMYGSGDSKGLTIRNCDISGDIGYLGKGLVLEGLVKIGLLNYGLKLRYGSDVAAPMDASKLTEGSEIFVGSNTTVTQPGANIAYFKGANRTILEDTTEGIVASIASSGTLGGYCPHCNERVVWTAFSTTKSLVQNCLKDSADDTDPACTGGHIESGHYYLGASITDMKTLYIGFSRDLADVKDVVIDTAGYSVTATNRAFYPRSEADGTNKSVLTILDSYGGNKITGKGGDNQPGGVIYNESSILNIYGGNFIYSPVEGRNVTGGGVILNGYQFNMYGGTLDASAFTYTDVSTADKNYSYNGGCLLQYSGTKYAFNMTAGRMIGGTTAAGGCAYFGGNNTVNITGGQFSGGVSKVGSGGNIRMFGSDNYTKAEFNMSGASVRGGRVEVTGTGGGNLSVAYGTVNVSDSYIEGGHTAAYGGNILTGVKANVTFTDCIIEGGYAGGQGGNAHLSATNTTTLWDNCLFLNGSATYGGNVQSNNGNNTFKGGQFLFGTARTSYGGNLGSIAGNNSATSANYTRLIADDQGNAPLLAGGHTKTYGGNIYNGGVMDLQAAQLIHGSAETSGQDIYMSKASNQGKLTIGSGVIGTFYAQFNSGLYNGDVYGQPISRTVCQELNASIIIDSHNDALLCAKDGQLYVGAIANIDWDGNYTWYTDTASAVEACDKYSYVKLFIAQDVVLTKNCAVDISGQTVNISGPYTFYGMDSSGDGFEEPTGKAILSAETKLASDTNMAGKRYIASKNGSEATFHRLENRISGVTLRPAADGIYYTAEFGGDATLVNSIDSYGVAVSLVDMPRANFRTDPDTRYTNFDAATLQGGASANSVLIENILQAEGRTAQENSQNGQMPIYATAYLIMKDGSVVLSDNSSSAKDDIAYSLRDVMASADELIINDPINFRTLTNPLRAFYDKWKDNGMADWTFKKIITPAEDDVIDILMIGNSFCYYYVEELAAIAAADGVKLRVCNVYYSGCRLNRHYNWWIEGASPYQFFDTTAEGGRKQTNNVSLEWCLNQGEWDYISMQTPVMSTDDPELILEENKLYLDSFVGYFREQFPKAQLVWHQPWAYAVGTATNGTVTTPERQVTSHIRNQLVADLFCEKYDMLRINTGDAWKLIRDEGYDKLCARIGKGTNHEGDYYHDGDIGGGQYLNACVWYEIITGNCVVGNTYRPVYKYKGTEIPLNSDMSYEKLQEAAHAAVSALYPDHK